MTRSGAAEQPEPDHRSFRILDPLLSAFRTAALRFAHPLAAWRLRLRHWWQDLALELTLDRRPHKTKQIRKSKAKSKGRSARHPAPVKPF